MNLALVLCGIGAAAVSGVPELLAGGRRAGMRTVSAILMGLGSALGLGGAVGVLISGERATLETAWHLPWGGGALLLDPLAAVFLVPVFLIPALGALYAQEYGRSAGPSRGGRSAAFFYGLLAGSMGLVTLARDSVLFLMAWEVMALSGFFAIVAESEDPAVSKAGWIYLAATHLGTLCLVSLFAVLKRISGSTALSPLPGGTDATAVTSVFALAVVGFGFKAGFLPLHVWLPGAHANAPSHVSAVLSGVMLKMGVYGILRVTGLLPRVETWHGNVLLAVGGVSAVLGAVLSLSQGDLKRALAYSSIENVGIVAIGMGLALAGRASGRWEWTVLGLAGALLHVWNHGLFKSLLFMNAGAVLHAAHTRETAGLGGLARAMPRTAALFAIGAAGICGLPGLNGFVGEWLLYAGLFRSMKAVGGGWAPAALAAPALALVGALALACFAGLYGGIFLGSARGDGSRQARDPGPWMRVPMVVLASACLAVGIFPAPFAALLGRAVRAWGAWPPGDLPGAADLVPLRGVPLVAGGALAVLAVLAAVGRRLLRGSHPGTAVTWDCGYAAPAPRMQYTALSFTSWISDLFRWCLWPKVRRPPVSGLFPRAAAFKRLQPDPFLDRGVLPAWRGFERLLFRLERLRKGGLQVYVLASLAIMLLLFWWGRNGR